MLKAIIVALATLYAALPAWAQVQEPRFEAPSAIDRQYMQEQRDTIDALARRHMGQPLRDEAAADLQVLQRLLDQQLVARDDGRTLQAMGAVMGHLLAAEEKLDWVIYIDQQGRSRALRIPGTREVLFPMTMISRRYETGLEVDVSALYRKSQEIVAAVRHRNSPF